MKDRIIKRLKSIHSDQLQKSINELQMYNIIFYNNHGEFSYCKFQSDCIETINCLLKNERPDIITNIRYELAYLIGIMGAIVGMRNLDGFLNIA
jgi:hypothetical protein